MRPIYPSTGTHHQLVIKSTPTSRPVLYNPNPSSSSTQGLLTQKMASSGDDIVSGETTTKPLTMFYNGSVAIFHLPQDKAEDLMKMAAGREDGGDGGRRQGGAVAANDHGDELVAKMKEEMPIASKRSLQRFFQKRKERLYRP